MYRFRPFLVVASFVLSACSGGMSQSNSLVPAPSQPGAASQKPQQRETNGTRRLPQGRTFSVIHTFTGGADGANPNAGLTADAAGNLYGTTELGAAGFGNVFKLKHGGGGWTLSALYAFTGGADGGYPTSRVVFGPGGFLYGTNQGVRISGIVYKLGPGVRACVSVSCPWNFTKLHQLNGSTDGGSPEGDLTFDPSGNIYGTAAVGGAHNMGTVWEIASTGTFSTLYAFGTNGSEDGDGPWAGVEYGPDGWLYGTTHAGGEYGHGMIFRLNLSGGLSNLYEFQGGSDGQSPASGLIYDASTHEYYGSTMYGGSGGSYAGTLFELTPGPFWTLSTIHPFSGSGGPQNATLVADSSGNMYGTTYGDGANNHGNVFELTAQGQYVDLYDFTGGSDGSSPLSTIAIDANGNLYGTTDFGGSNSDDGVVFEITASQLDRHSGRRL